MKPRPMHRRMTVCAFRRGGQPLSESLLEHRHWLPAAVRWVRVWRQYHGRRRSAHLARPGVSMPPKAPSAIWCLSTDSLQPLLPLSPHAARDPLPPANHFAQGVPSGAMVIQSATVCAMLRLLPSCATCDTLSGDFSQDAKALFTPALGERRMGVSTRARGEAGFHTQCNYKRHFQVRVDVSAGNTNGVDGSCRRLTLLNTPPPATFKNRVSQRHITVTHWFLSLASSTVPSFKGGVGGMCQVQVAFIALHWADLYCDGIWVDIWTLFMGSPTHCKLGACRVRFVHIFVAHCTARKGGGSRSLLVSCTSNSRISTPWWIMGYASSLFVRGEPWGNQ